jgi:hypothetical protein
VVPGRAELTAEASDRSLFHCRFLPVFRPAILRLSLFGNGLRRWESKRPAISLAFADYSSPILIAHQGVVAIAGFCRPQGISEKQGVS